MTFIKHKSISAFSHRLQYRYSSDPSKFNYLYSFVQFETFPSKNMDFVVELFRNLLEHPEWFTIEACKDSYGKTLKIWLERQKWFNPNLPMKRVIPALSTDRQKFMEKIEGNGDVMGDIKKFCSIFTPLIKEIDKFLASWGSDKSKLLIDGEEAS
ncbi:hypothetical protein D8674_027823 [Pyrus ussuriensis x Pyrus communis]|uniref:Uncharacterized protein n=1 Tax=Pyrus ussuriensis x Pyrus communis TaxID=2448454 RepID=A0A5N5ICG4_9ROSA|nr:hypothetical protein D8674_027823 [Pyrus ussuriensis x Pyrus communis]